MFCLWTRIRVKVGDRGKYSISVSSVKITNNFRHPLCYDFFSAFSVLVFLVSSVIPDFFFETFLL